MPKTILVTGGAKRVGRIIATTLAKAGHNIVIHCNQSEKEALSAAEDIKALGVKAWALKANLEDETFNLMERATTVAGQIDGLINSASLFEYDQADSFSYESLKKQCQVNFLAPMRLSMQLYEIAKREKRQALVINVLDQKLINHNVDYFSYTISKEALFSTLRFTAMACAPHLRINALLPGLMLPSGEMTQQEFESAVKVAALGVSNTAEQLAESIQFLIQSEAITGQWFAVDGGCHLVPRKRDVAFKEDQ